MCKYTQVSFIVCHSIWKISSMNIRTSFTSSAQLAKIPVQKSKHILKFEALQNQRRTGKETMNRSTAKQSIDNFKTEHQFKYNFFVLKPLQSYCSTRINISSRRVYIYSNQWYCDDLPVSRVQRQRKRIYQAVILSSFLYQSTLSPSKPEGNLVLTISSVNTSKVVWWCIVLLPYHLIVKLSAVLKPT